MPIWNQEHLIKLPERKIYQTAEKNPKKKTPKGNKCQKPQRMEQFK